jgi:AcrR family transcriptional regulator
MSAVSADRSDPRSATRARRRDQLLSTVIETIRAEGPGVSMDQLAAACGITKPILYKHFASRDGLVEAVDLRFASDIAAEVLGHLTSSAAPREVFASTVSAYLAFIRRDPALYRFIRTNSDPEGLDLLVQLVAGEVTVVLRERLEDAGVDASPASLWATALVGMALIAGEWWLGEPDRSLDEVTTHLTDLVWHGFAGIGLPDEPVLSDPKPTEPTTPEVPVHGAVRRR